LKRIYRAFFALRMCELALLTAVVSTDIHLICYAPPDASTLFPSTLAGLMRGSREVADYKLHKDFRRNAHAEHGSAYLYDIRRQSQRNSRRQGYDMFVCGFAVLQCGAVGWLLRVALGEASCRVPSRGVLVLGLRAGDRIAEAVG